MVPHSHRPVDAPRRWRPRFGMGGLLMVMLVFSVLAAAGSHLVQGLEGDRRALLVFVVLTLAAPVLLLTLVSLLQPWIGGRPR